MFWSCLTKDCEIFVFESQKRGCPVMLHFGSQKQNISDIPGTTRISHSGICAIGPGSLEPRWEHTFIAVGVHVAGELAAALAEGSHFYPPNLFYLIFIISKDLYSVWWYKLILFHCQNMYWYRIFIFESHNKKERRGCWMRIFRMNKFGSTIWGRKPSSL